MTKMEILNELTIELDTERDGFDFELEDLSVDISEHKATVLQAVNSLAEQITRVELLTEIYMNKALKTIGRCTVNDDEYKLIKQQFSTLCNSYITKCLDVFHRYI